MLFRQLGNSKAITTHPRHLHYEGKFCHPTAEDMLVLVSATPRIMSSHETGHVIVAVDR